MSLGGNSIDIGGAFRNNGTINLTPGAIGGDPPIQQPPPPLFVASIGSLSGTGVVNGNVFMQGTMSPGDSLGKFTINGNYSQSASGALDILLGGTGAGQFGQLDILGIADLSGTLDVELFAGFDPQAGDVFEILEAGDINTFDFLKLLFPTLADGLSFKVDREGIIFSWTSSAKATMAEVAAVAMAEVAARMFRNLRHGCCWSQDCLRL
jgi:hypothetical protein